MKPKQTLLDLFPVTTLRQVSHSTFFVLCPCCESRVDAFPSGNDTDDAPARCLALCELCEMSFDYEDKDIRQTQDELLSFDSMTHDPGRTSPAGLSSYSPTPQKADTMDPNQTFTDMFNAMRVDDHETARELALALTSWLAKGGFYPKEEVETYLGSVLFRTAGSQEPQPPFSLTCCYCDDGQGITTEEEAMEQGWTAIEPALQLLQANYLGVCPDCRPRYEADSTR